MSNVYHIGDYFIEDRGISGKVENPTTDGISFVKARYEGSFVDGYLCVVDVRHFGLKDSPRALVQRISGARELYSSVKTNSLIGRARVLLPDRISCIDSDPGGTWVLGYFSGRVIDAYFNGERYPVLPETIYNVASFITQLHKATGLGIGSQLAQGIRHVADGLLFPCPLFPVGIADVENGQPWLCGLDERAIICDRQVLAQMASRALSNKVFDATGHPSIGAFAESIEISFTALTDELKREVLRKENESRKRADRRCLVRRCVLGAAVAIMLLAGAHVTAANALRAARMAIDGQRWDSCVKNANFVLSICPWRPDWRADATAMRNLALRRQEVDRAVQASRLAQEQKRWRVCLDAANRALAIDPLRSEALALREQAARLVREAAEAENAKNRSLEAWRGAFEENAVLDAKELFDAGWRAASRAAVAFEAGDFTASANAYTEAAASYASAKSRALAMQKYRKAKDTFDAALAPDTALLAMHGGAKWADVQRQQRIGAVSTDAPAEGFRAYVVALETLPAAVTEAAAERERHEKLAVSMAAARLARSSGKWQTCLNKSIEALALDAEHAEALALKSEAELECQAAEQKRVADARRLQVALNAANSAKTLNDWQTCLKWVEEALNYDKTCEEAIQLRAFAENALVPKLNFVAELDGVPVAASVSDGKSVYTTPQTFILMKNAVYRFTLSYADPASKKLYKSVTIPVLADWSEVRTERISIQVYKSPPEEHPWNSPATGMEFVWVPALKIWVGKYEVSNDEYRKKEPQHDSGSLNGQTLNGERQPVVLVNFDDARAYATWLTDRDKEQLDGLRYRVISETEWQTAAQCGDGREYPWGAGMPPKYGNYCGQETKGLAESMINNWQDGYGVSCPVEKSGKNDWGLYGMGGNVWECCAADASGGAFGAWRGASWNNRTPDYLRSAYRYGSDGSGRDSRYGFRLALSR